MGSSGREERLYQYNERLTRLLNSIPEELERNRRVRSIWFQKNQEWKRIWLKERAPHLFDDRFIL
jgi:hypothetical protein